jgi:hypothetical protein
MLGLGINGVAYLDSATTVFVSLNNGPDDKFYNCLFISHFALKIGTAILSEIMGKQPTITQFYHP